MSKPLAQNEENPLTQRALRYATIFEALDEGFCLVELIYGSDRKPINYRFLETNSAFERQSGLTNAVGKTILDFVPDFETVWFEVYRKVAETGEGVRFESEFKSMGFWFDVHVTRADSDGRIAILFKDITASKSSEEKLRISLNQLKASEERFRTLFDSIDEGFCVVDVIFDERGHARDYKFVQVNPAFARQTGLPNAEGRTARELIPHLEDSWFELFGKVVRTGESTRFVNEALPLRRTFDVYASRIGGAESTCVSIVFSDITERTRADNELRRLAAQLSESDRRKNEFLATLAHELRNPLAPLSNGLHLIQRVGTEPSAINRIVNMMERQVAQMVHLVDDLLDVARISNGKVELKIIRTPIQPVIATAIETSMHLLSDKMHDLQLEVTPELIDLDIDPTRLAQMLSNILNNAAKYTPSKGKINLKALVDGDEFLIAVADNGIGISETSRETVFDMFTQVDHTNTMGQGGLGIGLSLVKKLAVLHGGAVSVFSEGLGSGSTFEIRLPLPKAPNVRLHNQSSATFTPDVSPESLKILVVDDNKDAAESLSALLQMSGHRMKTVYDGREAVSTATSFVPDIMFLDIGLPGLNGYEVAKAIRGTPGLEQMTLVALTGWGAEADKARTAEAGFNTHLTKPAELGAVDRLIAQHIAERA
jgi:PAS domain S-box-containing protein